MLNLFKSAVVIVAVSVSVHASNKETSYELINTCQYIVDNNKGKFSVFYMGYILGLSNANRYVLHRSNIANEYAHLDKDRFAQKMCELALHHRKSVNEETGGKYDDTKFQKNLDFTGYTMATYVPN